MSIYNPFNQQNRYYDPAENIESQGTNPTQMVAGAVKKFAVWGALFLIGQAATKTVGIFAKKGLESMASNAESIVRRTIAQKTLNAMSFVKASTTPIINEIKESAIYKAGLARTEKLEVMKAAGSIGYGTARITSAFTNPKTFIAAAAGVWKRNVLAGAGVAYGVDQITGTTSHDLNLKRKKWYDVPGKIQNFGKWFLGWNTIGMTMGAAGPIIGAMGSIGLQSAEKVFGGAFGKKVLESLAPLAPGIVRDQRYAKYFNHEVIGNLRSTQEKKFAISAVSKGLALTKTVGEAFRTINAALYTVPDAVREAINAPGLNFGARTKKAFSTLNAALKNVKEIQNRPRKESFSYLRVPGLRAAEALETLANKPVGHGGQIAFSDGLREHLISSQKTAGESFMGKVFSFLEPLKIRDLKSTEWQREILGNLQKKFVKSDADLLMNNIMNMRLGANIYKSWKGTKGGYVGTKGVDLNAFAPINIMKRAASYIVNKKFMIPLTKMNFSLGDLTGSYKHLTEKPSFDFWDKNIPPFQIGKSFITINDHSRETDPLVMYMNGHLAVFDGLSATEMSTHRRLYYSHKSSRDHAFDLRTMNIDRWKAKCLDAAGNNEAKAMEYFNKVKEMVDHIGANNHPIMHFVERRGFGLPTMIEGYLNTFLDMAKGKIPNRKELDSIFTGSETIASNTASRTLPIIDNMYKHTSQVFSRILHNRHALDEIATFFHDKTLGQNLLDVAFNDQDLAEKIEYAMDSQGKFKNNNDMINAVKRMKAFPEQAHDHHVIKRLGSLSEMSSIDVARVNYIEDIFNTDFIETGGTGQLGMIGAADHLFQKEIITEKECKALKLHAKLSIFKDDGLIRNIHNRHGVFLDVLAKVRNRAKMNNWNVTDEIIDFASHHNIRQPRTKFNQYRTFPKGIPGLEQEPLFITSSEPYTSVREGAKGVMLDIAEKTLDSVTDMIASTLPFKKRYLAHHGIGGNLKYIGNIIGTSAAVFGAYRLVDFAIAANPLFNNTMFDNGLTGFNADILARARLGMSRAADITGITATMKYMHGLAPKSETTIPGAIFGGIVGFATARSPLGVLKGVIGGAIANRLAAPYIPDMTKTHEELVEEYSGRKQVPIMKSPTWLLGGTPWEGSKVLGYVPNWYVRTKSRWKESSTMYGSAFGKLIHEPLPFLGFNVGDIISPYFNERAHYFSRPYPQTGELFSEVPIIGGLLSNTIGRIIKPRKTMHQEFLTSDMISADEPGNPYPFAVRPPTLEEGRVLMTNPSPVRTLGGQARDGGTVNIADNKYWSETAAEHFLYDIQNFAGLRGFLGGAISNRLFGKNTVIPTLQTAGRIASFSRSYTDLNLGGIGILSEPLRRLVNKPPYRMYGINPIPNMMPNWLPEQFITGDPYEKLVKGELRLPGCITPDTFVLSEDGLKYAKDITNNDKLLTLNGFHKIEHIIPKYKNEELMKIDAYSGLPITVTKNHHILCIKTKQCKYHKIEESSKKRRPCKPFCNKSFCKNCDIYKNYEYEWISSKNLEEGDYLVLPKIKQSKKIKSVKTIDIVKKYNVELQNKETFRFTRILNGKKIYNNKPIKFPEEIIFDKKFMYFAGYYLAEGAICRSRGKISSIILCVSLNELSILEDFQKWLKETYYIDSYINKSIEGDYYTFGIFSCIFSYIIAELFGYTETKKINKNFDNIMYLIGGLFDGDGHISKESIILTHSKKYRYSYQLPLVLLQENIPYSIRGKNSEIFITKIPAIKIDKYIRFKKIDYYVEHKKTNTFIELEDRFLVKIRKISKVHYKGKVYDYQVKKEHNYVTSFLMHNSAYMQTHPAIKRTMPARASIFGGTEEHIIQYFTGLLPPVLREEYNVMEKGTEFHSVIQDQLASEGLLIQAEALVQDVKNDITGHIDAIIRDGQGGAGRKVLEIKTINSMAFDRMTAPKNEHVSQINLYLKETKIHKGILLYVNRDNPAQVKTFQVQYSYNRFERDLQKLKKARSVAATMMQEGQGDTMGNSYSWVDRLNILADTAPSSLEYKEAKVIVEKQIKFGVLTNDEITKYKNALQIRQTRIRQYELFPNRFKNKLLTPDTEYNTESINEDIKAGANYSLPERAAGWLWEHFTNTNAFFINKLWAIKDPIEHYKMTRVIGKEYKPWDEPIKSWLTPYAQNMRSKTNPIAGAYSFGIGGWIFGGGPVGATVAGAAGAAYGALHGLFRMMTDSVYVPRSIKEKREITSYFDAAKYAQNDMLAQLSQGLTQREYMGQRDATLTAFNMGQNSTVANLFRGVGYPEKPYIESWINVRDDKERQKILSYVPADLAAALKKQWAASDNNISTERYNQQNSEELTKNSKRIFDKSILNPSVPLQDIELKTIQDHGFEAHEFGLGWNEQMLRIQNYRNAPKGIDEDELQNMEFSNQKLDVSSIKGTINNLFNGVGIKSNTQVYVNNGDRDYNNVHITIRRDRSMSIINALSNRKRLGL